MVKAEVTDAFASIEFQHYYMNDTEYPLEATFIFP